MFSAGSGRQEHRWDRHRRGRLYRQDRHLARETGPAIGLGPNALFVVRDGRGFTISGEKAFVRDAGAADLYLVFATMARAEGGSVLAAFIIEKATPGLVPRPIQNDGPEGPF